MNRALAFLLDANRSSQYFSMQKRLPSAAMQWRSGKENREGRHTATYTAMRLAPTGVRNIKGSCRVHFGVPKDLTLRVRLLKGTVLTATSKQMQRS
jgi:hypothetical protein